MNKTVLQVCSVICIGLLGFVPPESHPMNGFAIIAISAVFAILSIGGK